MDHKLARLPDRLLDRYCRALDAISALFLAIMVVLVFGNVALRYVFNTGITVSEEVGRWLFVWITFMGAIVALRRHGHLGTDMLIGRLPAKGKRACLALAQIAMLYVSWLMLQGSWIQARINLDVAAPATGASVAIIYASGVLFGASAMVILVLDLVCTLTGRMQGNDMSMVQDSEESAQLGDAQPNPRSTALQGGAK